MTPPGAGVGFSDFGLTPAFEHTHEEKAAVENIDPATWMGFTERVLDKYGLSVLIVLCGLIGGGWAIRAAWSFLKPKIENYYEGLDKFFTTIESHSTKVTETLSTLTNEGKAGHEKTHLKLDQLHEVAKETLRKVEK